MHLSSIEARFLNFLDENNEVLEKLTPSKGISLMLDFYRNERVDNCPLDQDGDMLLFEWGCSKNGDDELFFCMIVRQLIATDAADDEIYQLQLAFFYIPTEEFRHYGKKNHWCATPDQLEEFQSFIHTSPPFLSMQSIQPVTIKLTMEISG